MNEVIIGSILSALATGIGALPILLFKNVTHKWRDILLAFTAGIMTSASMLGLIPESLASGGLIPLTVGIILGIVTLSYMERKIPHMDLEHSRANIKIDSKAFLIIMAVTMHNLPEGLSVGVSYASGDGELGNLIALAIGLQNAPEGFLVALFLVTQNIGRFKALLIATLTGAVEIVTSLFGFYLSYIVEGLVGYGLAFAAGAMLFIIYKELIPESHGDGNARNSTYSFVLGLLIMLYLIEYFG